MSQVIAAGLLSKVPHDVRHELAGYVEPRHSGKGEPDTPPDVIAALPTPRRPRSRKRARARNPKQARYGNPRRAAVLVRDRGTRQRVQQSPSEGALFRRKVAVVL